MKPVFRSAVKPLALAVSLLGAGSAHALQFELDSGLKANIDTVLTYGVSIRTQNRDPKLIGIANGGTSRSVNEDDGDLNFDQGKPFANLVKATVDVELKYNNFGFFGRGLGYYDFDLAHSDKLGPTGRDRLGKQVVGLDGFVFGTFTPIEGATTRVRAGRQVISWGESTFIPNGINVINPVDLSKLRIPGSDLKEAFLPTTGIWVSQEITKAFSVEGFYLTNFDKVRLDPRGSYFSNNDAASDDADRVIVTFGRRQDQHFAPSNPIPPTTPGAGPVAAALYGPFNPAAMVWVPRSPDQNPSDDGQFGIAFRYLAHELNNTELGFYYMNYHSRTPFFSGVTGTPSSSSTTVTSIVTCGVVPGPCPLNAAQNGTARYFVSYPENIKLYGVSFNTAGPAGIALQGEYSYRPSQPVQIATAELILATLGLPNVVTGFTQLPGAPTGATAAALVPGNTTLTGYRRLHMSQFQTTATKSWPSMLKADQLIVVGEAGFNWFHNLPSDLVFSGAAAYLPATAFGALLTSNGSQQTDGFLTNFSWGYRVAGRLEYSNLIFNGNVAPRLAFAHDVKGVGPNFTEGVKSASVGVSWDYQRKWIVDASYTNFFGGKTFCGTDTVLSGVPPTQPAAYCSKANPLADRDFVSFSVSYAF